eukprot:CAMPEP_0182489940 /NCGR_PEP_ID=MMETSP1319-20130603/49155_1 /TAXON_ID=172717 /ORGANISM="Bolidomonas pacifica, Strain RCC208" /LENGTH=781 /DNA_ID=CAMNT_0024692065 /DNA_START=103 /DNA_END=2445 /DNA_ORIENTATION=-
MKLPRKVLGGRTEQFELFAFLVAVAMVVENIVFLSSSFKTARFCRTLRVIFLVDAQSVLKRLVRNCISSLIALREVLLLLSTAVIAFFSLTAIVVWPPGTTAEGATHFYSVHRAIMSFIFASMGAVNFPDIMLPAVNEDFRSSCVFFMTFMVLVVVWLLNLCLATVYQQYRTLITKRALHKHMTSRKVLLSAYVLLDTDGDKVINKEDFLDAVMLVKDMEDEDKRELDFLWEKCDLDKDGKIDEHDFFSVCDILVCNVKTKLRTSDHIVPTPYDGDRDVSPEERKGWEMERSRVEYLSRFLNGGLFPSLRQVALLNPFLSYVVISCILGSNVVLLYSANAKLTGQDEPVWCEQVEYFFVSVFVLEVILKVLAVGLVGYAKTPWWKFDFFITLASLIGIILDLQSEVTAAQATSVPLRMSKVLRTIRLIRVFSRVKKFRMIISTSTKFFPQIPRFLLLVMSILYVYMIIGIEAFGFDDQKQWEAATNGTSYSDMVYEIPVNGEDASYADMSYSKTVNFQSPQNALITLFSLLMVNNWHIIHDAVQVAVGSTWAVSLYFVSFHILAVIVVMNLIVSTFLERYLQEWEKNNKHRQERQVHYDDQGAEKVPGCISCNKPFSLFKRPAVECAVSRKMCCTDCCRLYIEPRLDISATADPKKLANFSNQKVGYEPLRIEKVMRQGLVEMWKEDANLEKKNTAPVSTEDDEDGMIELMKKGKSRFQNPTRPERQMLLDGGLDAEEEMVVGQERIMKKRKEEVEQLEEELERSRAVIRRKRSSLTDTLR